MLASTTTAKTKEKSREQRRQNTVAASACACRRFTWSSETWGSSSCQAWLRDTEKKHDRGNFGRTNRQGALTMLYFSSSNVALFIANVHGFTLEFVLPAARVRAWRFGSLKGQQLAVVYQIAPSSILTSSLRLHDLVCPVVIIPSPLPVKFKQPSQ